MGREDRNRDLNSKKYDKNLRSENSFEVLSKEARDKTTTCGNKLSCHQIASGDNNRAFDKKQKHNCSLINMECLAQLYMKRNNYDVPSSVGYPKNAPSVSLNLYLSPNMEKKALKMLEYEQSVMNTNMMIYNSGYLNKSHQILKKLQDKKKAPQYKVKTSSDADANKDPDLARVEGLHPREGISRHHALPV